MIDYTPRHRRDIDPIEDDWRPEAECRCHDGIFCPLCHPDLYAKYETRRRNDKAAVA